VKSADIDFDRLLKRLNLANTRRVWRDLIARAETEQWSFHDFLATLVGEEIAQRSHTRLARLSRRAQFPFLKTIDDFDFTYQSTVRLALLGSALSPDFVTEGRSLVLLGKPGRGKTHLAVAIAYRAIQNGFEALFVTAAELIDELSAAFRKGRLAEALARFTHPHVLVVDEVGYLTYGTDAANMLFHVVNDRHKRKRSMIFTTNKPLAAWGRVLHDEDLAQAIVDRVLERGRLLQLDGPSMRTKHLGLDDPTAPEAPSGEVVRISGIHRSELPEPTLGQHDVFSFRAQTFHIGSAGCDRHVIVCGAMKHPYWSIGHFMIVNVGRSAVGIERYIRRELDTACRSVHAVKPCQAGVQGSLAAAGESHHGNPCGIDPRVLRKKFQSTVRIDRHRKST